MSSNLKYQIQLCKVLSGKKSNTVKTLQEWCQQATLSTWLTRKLQWQVQINPRITAKALLAKLRSTGVNISRQTLQQTLYQESLFSFNQGESSLSLCKDESSSHLFFGHMKQRVRFIAPEMWLSWGEKRKPQNAVTSVIHRGFNLMFCAWYFGLSDTGMLKWTT